MNMKLVHNLDVISCSEGKYFNTRSGNYELCTGEYRSPENGIIGHGQIMTDGCQHGCQGRSTS